MHLWVFVLAAAGKEENREAYDAVINSGLTFIDTAEVGKCVAAQYRKQAEVPMGEGAAWPLQEAVGQQLPPHHGVCMHGQTWSNLPHALHTTTPEQVYGFGKSEEFLAEFMKATGTSPIIATKYAPQPWRLTQGSVPAACKASLSRLQLQQMGLYIQHW